MHDPSADPPAIRLTRCAVISGHMSSPLSRARKAPLAVCTVALPSTLCWFRRNFLYSTAARRGCLLINYTRTLPQASCRAYCASLHPHCLHTHHPPTAITTTLHHHHRTSPPHFTRLRRPRIAYLYAAPALHLSTWPWHQPCPRLASRRWTPTACRRPCRRPSRALPSARTTPSPPRASAAPRSGAARAAAP
ncbi:hypothetical protein BST61_g7520 [Cercospora zeina]